jgi:hypothetical protein
MAQVSLPRINGSLVWRLGIGAVVTVVAVAVAFVGWRDPAAPAGPSNDQLAMIDKLVNVLMHDSTSAAYDHVENAYDGRGYVAGRADFSTAGGEVLAVVEAYSAQRPDNVLAGFTAALQDLAAAASPALTGLDGFVDAWSAAASDPEFRRAQDDLADQLYWEPAQDNAKKLGVRSALGLLILLDTLIQHGATDQPDGFADIVNQASAATGGTPAQQIVERTWLARLLSIRRNVLEHPSNLDREDTWAASVGRVDALASLLNEHDDDLAPPVTVNPYGTPHEVDLQPPMLAESPDDATPDFPLDPNDTASPAVEPGEPDPSVSGEAPASPEPDGGATGRTATVPPTGATTAGAPTSARPTAAQTTAAQPTVAPPPSTTVRVSDAVGLRAALAAAQPGQTIELADGNYNGAFQAVTDGTASKPITVTGSPRAVLSYSGYGFDLRADHWVLSGFTIRGASKGLVLIDADSNTIDGLTIEAIQQIGVQIVNNSDDNLMTHTTVRDTGRDTTQAGRAVSLGWTKSGWIDGVPDGSDRNSFVSNTFGSDARGGLIQIQEGTTGGIIKGNTFNGAGMTSADTLVKIVGNSYQVTDNVGSKSVTDGFATWVKYTGWGCGNTFRRNRLDVGGPGYGIRIDTNCTTPSSVYADNVVTNAGSGTSNVTLLR